MFAFCLFQDIFHFPIDFPFQKLFSSVWIIFLMFVRFPITLYSWFHTFLFKKDAWHDFHLLIVLWGVLIYDLFWTMFHMHERRMWSLLLWNVPHIPVSTFGLRCSIHPWFLCGFYVWIIPWKCDIEVPYWILVIEGGMEAKISYFVTLVTSLQV